MPQRPLVGPEWCRERGRAAQGLRMAAGDGGFTDVRATRAPTRRLTMPRGGSGHRAETRTANTLSESTANAGRLPGMSLLEIVAVVFGLLSVLFTVWESLWLWPTGLVSVALYIVVFREARLYSDMVLQAIYVPMQ